MARHVRWGLACILIGLVAVVGSAEEERKGLVRGSGWAFMIEAPAGWNWDRRSLYREGVEALFHPGRRLDLSGLFMYIQPVAAEWFSLLESSRAEVWEAGSFQEVRVYELDSGGGAVSLVGLLEDKGLRFALIMSAPSRPALESARPAFKALVKSFVLLEKE